MKLWMLAAVPMALLASQALAENWVALAFGNHGGHISIDKDSIRRGSDGLVYFNVEQLANGSYFAQATDCPRRKIYTISMDFGGHLDYPNWRDQGRTVMSGSEHEAELQYACANAG
jgi:hypothetical protein